MYLKRIELQGFKSFPEKIRLEFHPGVTAVVGPNGSGKSNISDAVRWVLGEQSAKTLRGAKMEDVIFAGTESRRPLGFAEVTMVIDNTDGRLPLSFSEISVTRRVYRSGESEYVINGSPCRLKDVHELFMDTGIGKEGYSIIGQGRIEEILSTKSEDRRLLFEEAAGIVKYKNRRHEAEGKLEKERQNLVRVDDIIAELSGQLAPLEKQSQEAREYLSLRDQLKTVQVSLFVQEAALAERDKETLTRDLENNLFQIEEENARQQALIERHTALQQQAEAVEEQTRQAQNAIQEFLTRIEQREGDTRLTGEQVQHLEADIARLRRDAQKREADTEALKLEAEAESARMNSLAITLETKRRQLQEKEESYRAYHEQLAGREQQVESYNAGIMQKMHEITEVKGNIQRQLGLYEQMNKRKEDILDQFHANDSLLRGKEVEKLAREKELAALRAQSAGLADEVSDLTEIMEGLTREQTTREEEHRKVRRGLNESRARHTLLADLEKSHEGYYKSVKAVLRERDRQALAGIYGAVAELAEAPRHLEVAIDIALGSATQHIVVQAEEDAQNAIEYLKRAGEGRATFLPITAVKPKQLGAARAQLLQEKGAVGVAKELISYDQRYEAVFASLLGATLIFEDLDTAVSAFKKYKHQYKIVTLAGDVLNPGGSMTGGSVGNRPSGSLFGRGREMRELESRIAALEVEEQQLRDAAEDYTNRLTRTQEIIDGKKAALQENQVGEATLNGLCQQSARELADLTARHEALAEEDARIMGQIADTNQQIRGLQAEHAALEADMARLKDELESYQSAILTDKGDKDERGLEITELKVSIGALEQNVQAAESNLRRMGADGDRLAREREQLTREIEENQARIYTKTAETASLKEAIEALQRQLAEQRAALGGLEETREALGQATRQTESDRRQNMETLSLLTNECTRLEMRQEQLETNTRRLFDHMWEEYQLTYQAALHTQTLDEPPAELQKLERQLKTGIQALGNVNVNAIEEYKTVSDRHAFLTAQRDDILQAEEKLQGIIRELTGMMEEQFREQFALISENFGIVFREMFGGGKAYLKLADEERILESGIDLIAQPPGKTLQSMSLLSGGERALTATALLFGILRMKPSPFCILDEVEAALDDANVSRYANYLKRFANETQFILITHRKGTMEAADTLYGVTMQEQGVSKLVSVTFKEEAQELVSPRM